MYLLGLSLSSMAGSRPSWEVNQSRPYGLTKYTKGVLGWWIKVALYILDAWMQAERNLISGKKGCMEKLHEWMQKN